MEEQSPYQNIPSQPAVPPSNYLIGAILATLFCCQILGIVSIIYAAQVNSKWQAGDVDGARQSSKNARLWMWLAVGSAVIIFIGAITTGIGVAILSDVFNW
ncbi:MAG TPA: CD225/dispanin family protein [Prolixibacteraceae bacterium]|nr:CD225/dispanin family protein [Prolixibacteraceae bacterium]